MFVNNILDKFMGQEIGNLSHTKNLMPRTRTRNSVTPSNDQRLNKHRCKNKAPSKKYNLKCKTFLKLILSEENGVRMWHW